MKKRLLFIMLALTLTLSLALAAGCKNPGTSSDDSSNPIDSASSPIDSASSPDDSSSTGDGSSSAECEHNFGDWIVDVAATCTEKGAKHRVCSKCDAVENDEIVAAGHSFGDWITDTDPSCTEKGAKHKICKNCSGIVNEDIPASHTVGDDGVCIVCGAICIATADDLVGLATRVSAEGWGTTTDISIAFIDDIDMTDVAYETPKSEGKTNLYIQKLIVAGNGHYIKGLSNPLFNVYGTSISISDLTIKDSTITKTEKNVLGFGAFIEGAEWCKVSMDNCHANNVNLVGGDTRAAVLVGYMVGEAKITNCSVVNCAVTASGSVAGVIGHSLDCEAAKWIGQTIEDCSVGGSTFTALDSGWRVGVYVGTVAGTTCINDCASTDNILVQEGNDNPDHELYGRIVGGTLEIDGAVYTTAAKLKAILTASNNVTLDKDYILLDDWTSIGVSQNSSFNIDCGENGHFISGLTTALFVDHVSINVKGLTIKDSVIAYTGKTATANGALIGNNNGADYSVTLENCHLDNVTVKNNNGDLRVGGFVGQQDVGTVSIKNCMVENSVLEGNSNTGAIIGHLTASAGAADGAYTISGCEVKNCTISATDTGSWRVGAVVGTVTGGGKLVIDDCTESGNIISQNEVAINNDHHLYGRIVDTATKTYVVIDGVKYGVSGVVAE